MSQIIIRNIKKESVDLIDKHAKEIGISRDKLISEVLDNYAERIAENQAAETVHTQLDSLMQNQNRLIEATNNSASIISNALHENMKLSEKILKEFRHHSS